MQKQFRKLNEELLSDKKKDKAKEDDKPKNLGFISSIDQPGTDDLCHDSGTPCHIIKDRHLFIELQPFRRKFSVANGTPLEAYGIGKIQIRSPTPINIANA
jgi:hypothetical protein